MISTGTLLTCSLVLERYLDVLSEHPDATTPVFRAMVADAAADINRARDYEFMNVRRELRAIPTETDQASLLQVTARK